MEIAHREQRHGPVVPDPPQVELVLKEGEDTPEIRARARDASAKSPARTTEADLAADKAALAALSPDAERIATLKADLARLLSYAQTPRRGAPWKRPLDELLALARAFAKAAADAPGRPLPVFAESVGVSISTAESILRSCRERGLVESRPIGERSTKLLTGPADELTDLAIALGDVLD
jgi:hypothetical protein